MFLIIKRYCLILVSVLLLCSCSSNQTNPMFKGEDQLRQYFKDSTNDFENTLSEVPDRLLRLKLWVVEYGPTKGESESLLANIVNDMDQKALNIRPALENSKEIKSVQDWRNYAADLYSTYKQYSVDYLRSLTLCKTKKEQLVMIDQAYEATEVLIKYLKEQKDAIYSSVQ